jgi:hypothetical protein
MQLRFCTLLTEDDTSHVESANAWQQSFYLSVQKR